MKVHFLLLSNEAGTQSFEKKKTILMVNKITYALDENIIFELQYLAYILYFNLFFFNFLKDMDSTYKYAFQFLLKNL